MLIHCTHLEDCRRTSCIETCLYLFTCTVHGRLFGRKPPFTCALKIFKNVSIKMTIFRALRAHLLLNYTQYLAVSSCFRRVFHEMCYFYTSYSYNVIAKSAGHACTWVFDHFKHQSDKFSTIIHNISPCFGRPCYHFYTFTVIANLANNAKCVFDHFEQF